MKNLEFYPVESVIESFPAYDIVRREPSTQWGGQKGCVVLLDDEQLGLKGNGYYRQYRIGSVVSYAMSKLQDPIEAVEDAKKRGHALHWINACGSMITAHQRAKEKLIEVTIGMMVWFEGRKFEIIKEPNDNLGLKPVELTIT